MTAQGQMTTPGSRLLDIDGVADLLNVPEAWLRKAVSARTVPFTKIGKHVRFTPEHIAAIIKAGEQVPGRHAVTARTKL
jgi:excisionase family DNA binding protein